MTFCSRICSISAKVIQQEMKTLLPDILSIFSFFDTVGTDKFTIFPNTLGQHRAIGIVIRTLAVGRTVPEQTHGQPLRNVFRDRVILIGPWPTGPQISQWMDDSSQFVNCPKSWLRRSGLSLKPPLMSRLARQSAPHCWGGLSSPFSSEASKVFNSNRFACTFLLKLRWTFTRYELLS